MFEIALAFVGGYFVGGVPLGLLVSRLAAGIDIRRHGTGNMGAANVREQVGTLPAAVVALGIFSQGLVPPLLARFAGGPETAIVAAAVGAVVGYSWPVFLSFRGGRAVGVATGAASALSPGGFVVLLGAYALGALVRQTSAGVLLGFVAYASYAFYSTDSFPVQAGSLLLLALIAVRRLEGVGRALGQGPFWPVVLDLLLFQRRPETPPGERK